MGWWVTFAAHQLGLLAGVTPFWESLELSLFSIVVAGLFAAAAYYAGAWHLEHQFNQLRADKPNEWKCQPNRRISPALHAEEVRWGCFNAFCAGSVGCAIFIGHLNDPILRCHWSADQSWLGFLSD